MIATIVTPENESSSPTPLAALDSRSRSMSRIPVVGERVQSGAEEAVVVAAMNAPKLGNTVGSDVGAAVGTEAVGVSVGAVVGSAVEMADGAAVGLFDVGDLVGDLDGWVLGTADG